MSAVSKSQRQRMIADWLREERVGSQEDVVARLALAGSRLTGGLRHATGQRRAAGNAGLARLSPAPLLALVRAVRARVEAAGARLESVSPEAVLARGYVLVTNADGQPVTEAARVKPGARLRLRFKDGTVAATADSDEAQPPN